MTAGARRVVHFDGRALHEAMDRKRQTEGLTWPGVAGAVWDQSAVLNDRRSDHPIATSTIKRLETAGQTSCQHLLFFLRWLGQAPEDFLTGPVVEVGDVTLPACGADRRLRWALKLTYACLDERRQADGLTWAATAGALACSPSQLTGLRTARFATSAELALRITQWLGRPAADFVYPAEW